MMYYFWDARTTESHLNRIHKVNIIPGERLKVPSYSCFAVVLAATGIFYCFNFFRVMQEPKKINNKGNDSTLAVTPQPAKVVNPIPSFFNADFCENATTVYSVEKNATIGFKTATMLAFEAEMERLQEQQQELSKKSPENELESLIINIASYYFRARINGKTISFCNTKIAQMMDKAYTRYFEKIV